MVVVVLAKSLARKAPLAELAGETGDGMGSASGVVVTLGAVETGRGISVGPAADVRAPSLCSRVEWCDGVGR